MESFCAKTFCEEPSLDKLTDKNITKNDWKFIAVYFNIKISSSMTKDAVRETVVKELIAKGKLGTEAMNLLSEEDENFEELLCPDEEWMQGCS